jgi:ABC-type antimicrobial peptide transport system permease subunit
VGLVALLVGVPVGVAVGRWTWQLFASTLGVATAATVPLDVLLLAVPVALLVVAAVAAVPSWKAGRLPTATVLRIE